MSYISGFTLVRNGIAGGYPFLEAILAALPLCDAFHVSQGYSSDDSWQALQALQVRFSAKVHLHRDRWPESYENGKVIAEVANLVRDRCTGAYCLYLQANEVLHEASRDILRALPRMVPQAELFALPFYNIMGSNLLWHTDYRRRLFKNVSSIRARGDGFDVGHETGGAAVQCELPEPFYRYRAAFPGNYIAKLEARLSMFNDPVRRASCVGGATSCGKPAPPSSGLRVAVAPSGS